MTTIEVELRMNSKTTCREVVQRILRSSFAILKYLFIRFEWHRFKFLKTLYQPINNFNPIPAVWGAI